VSGRIEGLRLRHVLIPPYSDCVALRQLAFPPSHVRRHADVLVTLLSASFPPFHLKRILIRILLPNTTSLLTYLLLLSTLFRVVLKSSSNPTAVSFFVVDFMYIGSSIHMVHSILCSATREEFSSTLFRMKRQL